MSKKSLHKNLLAELSALIEQGKLQISVQVNSTMTLVFCQVGKRVNDEVLNNRCVEYA
ncbi:MAG: hypothetical protein WBG48_06120 [Pricia sp.]